ncbi:MAG: 50S ribosomal protein L22 [Leptospiraceae bacterium]|nr:50S ribosomal protein L22 [Leptospiraceae bacterium]
MEAKAIARHIRVSPRKARLVANEIRGYDYLEAVDILKFTKKRIAADILKLVNSAAANAEYLDENVDLARLYVKKIYVDEGPSMKRFRPRARGRASRIQKKLSHITVVLSD